MDVPPRNGVHIGAPQKILAVGFCARNISGTQAHLYNKENQLNKNLINQLIFCGKLLYEQGFNHSHSGNISIRDGNKILIKRSGAMLGYLKPADIVQINLNDNKLDENASAEANVHRAIYLGCPEVKAVAHAHTIYATVLSFKLKEIKPLDAEGKFYLPVIPVLSTKETIGSEEAAKKLPALIKKHKAAFLKTHGVFAGAETLEKACLYISVTESVSKTIYLNSKF